ncbi:unnamed protein product [Brassica oleracea]
MLVQVRDRLSSSAKLLAPHAATRIWTHAYDPFEYPGNDPSVGCTSHPGRESRCRVLVADGFWRLVLPFIGN